MSMRTLIFRTIAPCLTSLMLLFSVFVLLRGHNDPGGGFIGGLIAASAFAIYGIAFGAAAVRRALLFPSDGDFRRRPACLPLCPDCCRLAYGVPFLTGIWTTVHVLGVTDRSVDGDGLRHRRLLGRRRLASLAMALALEERERRLMETALCRPRRPVLRRRRST